VCGKEVPWSEIARGFEYAKGEFVVLKDDELDALREEVQRAVEIQAFVDRDAIDPMLFDTPYYLEPEPRGRHAYALLRDVLQKTGKVGIAQVALRTRAHLAALRPQGRGLVVELLRYPHEVVAMNEEGLPAAKEKATAAELRAAETLVGSMSKPFEPGDYGDEYEARLKAALRERAGKKVTKHPKAKPEEKRSNVVDLVEVLKRSLEKHPGERPKHRAKRAGGTRKG
jgi:DNA end-binding protein Ku